MSPSQHFVTQQFLHHQLCRGPSLLHATISSQGQGFLPIHLVLFTIIVYVSMCM